MTLDGNIRINGLVLAGGKSVRMGQDKGMMAWHGKPQRYFMADLLSTVCDKVFISCRQDQINDMEQGYETLTDSAKYEGSGPTAAILSAFEKQPETAWLVVACDLPLLDSSSLEYLIANRNSDSIATTFESPHDGLPEPLITIWEPGSYTILKSKLAEGYKCPRKVLINNPSTILQPPYPAALTNTNTPEDVEKVYAIIGRQ